MLPGLYRVSTRLASWLVFPIHPVDLLPDGCKVAQVLDQNGTVLFVIIEAGAVGAPVNFVVCVFFPFMVLFEFCFEGAYCSSQSDLTLIFGIDRAFLQVKFLQFDYCF